MDKDYAVRLSITMKPELLERVTEYSKENCLSRSALIGMAVQQYLNAMESMPSLNKMLSAMSAVVDGTFSGNLAPDDAQRRMDAIAASYKALTGKNIE